MNVGVRGRAELDFESGSRIGEDRHAALEVQLDEHAEGGGQHGHVFVEVRY